MYGPYMAALARAADKKTRSPKTKIKPLKATKDGTNRWFTCTSCDVAWKTIELRSQCFCCGRFGKRGSYLTWR